MGTLAPPAIKRQYYAADDHAPHDARLHVRAMLGTWGLRHLTDVVQVIASELVTNAIQHADGDVMFWLAQTDTSVIVNAWDSNPNPPILSKAGELDEHGRGLALVAVLSSDTGYFPLRGGKVMWAQVMK
jgi:anti-sigma regulatory factor (Ser/Thr protein kinase)